MSIFDDIARAEKLAENDLIEIEAGKFLDLIDIWISCGYLLNSIEDENDKNATEAILTISNSYAEIGEKYAKEY